MYSTKQYKKPFFLFKTKFLRWIQTLIFVGLGVHFMTKGYVSLPAKTRLTASRVCLKHFEKSFGNKH